MYTITTIIATFIKPPSYDLCLFLADVSGHNFKISKLPEQKNHADFFWQFINRSFI